MCGRQPHGMRPRRMVGLRDHADGIERGVDRVRIGCLDDAARAGCSPKSGMDGAGVPRSPQSIRHAAGRRRAAARRRRGRRTSSAGRRARCRIGAPNDVALRADGRGNIVAARHVAPRRRPARQLRSHRRLIVEAEPAAVPAALALRGRRRSPPGTRPSPRPQQVVVRAHLRDACRRAGRRRRPAPRAPRRRRAPGRARSTAMWSSSVISCGRSGRRPRGPCFRTLASIQAVKLSRSRAISSQAS